MSARRPDQSLPRGTAVHPAARILSVGTYLPEERITNAELGDILGYDVETFCADRGIGVRHRAAPGQSTSDMAVMAAKSALERAGISASDVDLIILATDTPDFVTPPTSPIVQHELGASRAGAFDLNAACADETIALAVGSHYIALDADIERVLVIGAYGMSKWLDFGPYERSASKVLSMLFSDGASAIVLGAAEEPGFLASKVAAEGSYWDTYGIYLGTARPPDHRMIDQGSHHLRFHEHGHRVPEDFNAARWADLVTQTLGKVGREPSELKLLLTNQVERKATNATLARLGLGPDCTHWVADRLGYAGSASIFMALDDALKQGRLAAGDLVALCTTGAGFILATALFRWY